jgi:hypothetical protein
MTDTYTDGNELGGVLGELFAADPTTMRRRCQSCGDEFALAEHRAYRGAGIVLRCPGCGDVAVLIGECGAELVVEWRGAYRVRRPA